MCCLSSKEKKEVIFLIFKKYITDLIVENNSQWKIFYDYESNSYLKCPHVAVVTPIGVLDGQTPGEISK